MMGRRVLFTSLLALLAGFGLGLAYSWLISPVQYVGAEPRLLRNDFKDEYRSTIAAAFFSNPDLERARVRLALLGDEDPYQALTAQAQRMLAAGEPDEAVSKIALLASALQESPPLAVNPFPTETMGSARSPEPTSQAADTETATVEPPEPTAETDPTSTPGLLLTATPRPSRTPTPTLGAPYQLVGEETVCDPELEEGLLQVVVIDLSRRQIPGAEIIISWNSGEEHIFPGLKPEIGHGYADFVMTPDVSYSVRMADGGTPATNLSASDCETTGGEPYRGGMRITFQQP